MIKGFGKLALTHGGLSALFLTLLATGNGNIFTLPVATVFMMGTTYCALQWHVSKLFEKIEKRKK